MNCNELATAVHYKLPIIIAVLNNRTLEWFVNGRQCSMKKKIRTYNIGQGPDFVKLAEAYGAIGIRVTRKEEVVPAIEKALASDNVPVVIDFVIDINEEYYQ